MSDADAKAEELREEIEHTRGELGATIDAIEERLTPQHLADQAKETVQETTEAVREAAAGKVSQIIRSVRETMNRVAAGASERTATALNRAGERVNAYRTARPEAAGTAGQADAQPGAGSGWRTGNLPNRSILLAGALAGGLIVAAVLGRVLANRARADT